jgi:hypothetical protein
MATYSEDLRLAGRDCPVHPSRGNKARVIARRRIRIRRRVALGAVGVAVGIATLFGGGTGVASRPGAPRAVVIREGETLWDLARANAPQGIDLRSFVDAVVDLNDLEGAPEVGQRLRLPR